MNDSTTTVNGIVVIANNANWAAGDPREIFISDNAAGNVTGSTIDTKAVIIGNGGGSTINSGVTNSVIIGGASAITAAKDDTVYIGQDIIVANNISTTEGEISITSTNSTTSPLKIVNSTMTNGILLDVTSDSLTNGTGIKLRADAITTGDMLLLDASGDTMTGDGKFINCTDGLVSYFSISAGGGMNVNGEVIFSGIETIAAGGTSTALSLTESLHSIDADAGGDIFTLADGTIGQIMTIACLSATGVCTVTPANMSGGTSVTLNAAGETVILQFVDTNWYIMGGNAYTVI
jgi:hypothetical protein